MKYATQVIELLAAYPGRAFRMAEIIRHVSRGRALSPSERNAMRRAVLRVLEALADSNQIQRIAGGVTSCQYSWGGSLMLPNQQAIPLRNERDHCLDGL